MYSIALVKSTLIIDCCVFDLPPVTMEREIHPKIMVQMLKPYLVIFTKDDLEGPYDVIFSSYNPGGKTGYSSKSL